MPAAVPNVTPSGILIPGLGVPLGIPGVSNIVGIAGLAASLAASRVPSAHSGRNAAGSADDPGNGA